MENKELKQKIKNYFQKENFDVTLDLLFNDLNLTIGDLPKLEFCLNELVKERFVEKSSCPDHFEYDPGEKLGFGGIN